MSGRIRGTRGWLLVLPLLALFLFAFRVRLLTGVGGFLVVGDLLRKADGILVLSGEPTVRVREAAALYREKWAPKIVLTTPEPPAGHEELLRMEISIPLEPDIAHGLAVQFGVPPADIHRLQQRVNSTEAEAVEFRKWCRAEGWDQVLVVTSAPHTRRARWIFRKILGSKEIEVAVIASRYGEFRPESWWRRRRRVQNLIIEYQKLIFYALQTAVTPFSDAGG